MAKPGPNVTFDRDAGLYAYQASPYAPKIFFPATLVNPETQEAAAYPYLGTNDRLFTTAQGGQIHSLIACKKLLRFEAITSGSPGLSGNATILTEDNTPGGNIGIYDFQDKHWWIGSDDTEDGVPGAYGVCFPNGFIVTIQEAANIAVGVCSAKDIIGRTVTLHDVFAFDGGMMPDNGEDRAVDLSERQCEGFFDNITADDYVYLKLCRQDGEIYMPVAQTTEYFWGGEWRWMDSPCHPQW